MTLWCIARSPLMFGGNLPKNDAFTDSLITNEEVLAVNQKSANNRQLFRKDGAAAWVAEVPGSASGASRVARRSWSATHRRGRSSRF